MTIQKWLNDIYYDEWGTQIWNREGDDGAIQLVAQVRGWGRLQNEFKSSDKTHQESTQEAAKFQNEVGEFIVQAIREKIERDFKQEDGKILDHDWLLGERYKMMFEFAEWFKASDWKYDDETERGSVYTNSDFPSDKATIEEIYIQYVLN